MKQIRRKSESPGEGAIPAASDLCSFVFIRGFDTASSIQLLDSGLFLFRQECHEVHELRVRQSVLQAFRHEAEFQRPLFLDLILLHRVRLALRIAQGKRRFAFRDPHSG